MPFFYGLDVGSTWVKGVALDGGGALAATALGRAGLSFEASCAKVFTELRSSCGIDSFTATVATGYGRNNVAAATATRTEISCHARGALAHFPNLDESCAVVDIGGQDNKVIHIAPGGGVENFTLNRKCAAGTGAFIEEIARRLDIDLDRLEELAEGATEELTLSSFCTVFSATEVIQRIREGQSPENIARGIFNAVVSRVAEMGALSGRVILTGGVAAAFPVVARILAERTGAQVLVPLKDKFGGPQFTGALGAALYALDLE